MDEAARAPKQKKFSLFPIEESPESRPPSPKRIVLVENTQANPGGAQSKETQQDESGVKSVQASQSSSPEVSPEIF